MAIALAQSAGLTVISLVLVTGTCLYLPFGPHHTVDVWSNVCVWWLLVVAPEGTRGTTSRAVQVYSSRGYVAAKFGVTEVRTKYST